MNKDIKEELLESIMKFQKLIRLNSDFSLPRGEAMMLLYLSKYKDINPSYLSDKFGLSRSSITGILNSLEEKKYIKRIIDINDRRKMKVNLLDKGEAFIKKMNENHLNIFDKIINKIGNKDTKELIRIINKITESEDINDKNI